MSASFKSYYVVWKLNDSEKYYERDNEFKSYYVVWKQYTDDDGIQSYEVV